MIIKKYIVADMKEALTRAKYELGGEAIIISQRIVKIGKWYNPFKKHKLEVTVAVEKKEKVEKTPIIHVESIKSKDYIENPIDINPMFENASEKTREQLLSYSNLISKEDDNFTEEEIKDFIRIAFKDNCFDKKVGLKRINVMIGPTGAGKTTTIAKIAAKEYLVNKKQVGLITLDTYKIGAVEQIKTYANILGIPWEVVDEPEKMEEKINKLSHCDLIFIDTLGTSQKNTDKLLNIEKHLENIKESLNIYLVLSFSTEKNTMLSILDKYKQLKYNALILTKLDEVSSFTNFWSILENNLYPIEYFCHGQEVPDDIQNATIDNLIAYSKEIC